jgi:hypothetical protein
MRQEMYKHLGVSFDHNTYFTYKNIDLPDLGTMDTPLGPDSVMDPIPDGATFQLFSQDDIRNFRKSY